VERVYAPEEIHDQLLEKVVEKTRALRQGNPNSYDTDVGAICFSRQLEVARDLIDDAVENGATIRTGGSRIEGEGMFFQPTVLEGVKQDMRIVHEEIFGPVLPFVKVKDVREALRHANDSHLGLTAYVFTRDRARGRELAEQIESGTVMVNDVMSTYGMPETPWQGVKESGVGFVHADDGLRHMCQSRHVHYDRILSPKKELWWYPYSESRFVMLKKFMNLLFRRR
jgi:succinate-semialdehyde dehydrogenase/glutarate-semialdehyde dehydrogenase